MGTTLYRSLKAMGRGGGRGLRNIDNGRMNTLGEQDL